VILFQNPLMQGSELKLSSSEQKSFIIKPYKERFWNSLKYPALLCRMRFPENVLQALDVFISGAGNALAVIHNKSTRTSMERGRC
jgi:antitoxin component of MazEF toxin-antitoxin module